MRRACALLAVLAATLIVTASASAGQWVQVSCQNPDGSSSNAQGWSGTSAPDGFVGSSIGSTCDAAHPLTAQIGAGTPVATGSFETLSYAPPTGSTLAGGSFHVSGYAGGYGTSAFGAVAIFAPAAVYPGDLLYQCLGGGDTSEPCYGTGYSFDTTLPVPADAGGGVYLQTSCDGGSGDTCDMNALNGDWTEVQLDSAALLLDNSSTPTGSGFGGAALQAGTTGTPQLIFTAGDPGGPGVYSVSAAVDGTQIYSATPNANSGACVPHGTMAGTGALEFDSAQPCPASESVDIPVPTTKLKNGKHELTVAVTDAAGNTATVFDQFITVEHPTTTPSTVAAPKPTRHKAIRAKVDFLWVWRKTHTQLDRLTFHSLPAHSTVEIQCSGHACPRGLGTTSRRLTLRTLERHIYRHTLTSGGTLTITLAHAGETSERIRATIRNGRAPLLKLL